MDAKYVEIWKDSCGWRRIRQDEIPEETVTVHSGLFQCILCGQNLTFRCNKRKYFAHSKSYEDKDCEQRCSNSDSAETYNPSKEPIFPLRIVVDKNKKTFHLEIGILPLPEELRNKFLNSYFTIYPLNSTSDIKIGFERISINQIYWCPVYELSESYKIYKVNDEPELKKYWPFEVLGVPPLNTTESYTVFDAQTGKRLPNYADVQIKRHYLVLTRYGLPSKGKEEIVCHHICQKGKWNVWEIYTEKFNEKSASFFQALRCKLCDQPITLFPLWPPYIKTPYILHTPINEDVNFFFHGDGYTKGYPPMQIRTIHTSNGVKWPNSKNEIISVRCHDRQQLVTFGRGTSILKYIYLWNDLQNNEAEVPEIEVTDESGNLFKDGVYDHLPQKRYLVINAQFDGFVEIYHGNKCFNLSNFKAGIRKVIDLDFNQKIRVFQGLDCVWEAEFLPKKPTSVILKNNNEIHKTEDVELLKRLNLCQGNEIPISHRLGALADERMEEMPLVKEWLLGRLRKGQISEKALRILKYEFTK